MKALSIRQPWAWLIIYGGKDIENRTWATKFRGRFLVHASKQWCPRGEEYWLEHVKSIDHGSEKARPIPVGGGIIGSVELVDCVQSSESEWFEGPNGFVLRDPIALPFQEYKGKLNFFEVEYEEGNRSQSVP